MAKKVFSLRAGALRSGRRDARHGKLQNERRLSIGELFLWPRKKNIGKRMVV